MAHHLELATGRVVRLAHPDDAPRLVAMFERCSPASRYARFLAPLQHFPAAHLTDVVRPSSVRRSWVVDDLDTGQLVAVGSWFRNELRTAEVGLLVEDAAQRHGLGTQLLETLVMSARTAGITTLVATTHSESRHVRCMLGRLGRLTVECSGFTCDVRVELAAA
jgi:GNAT superfamily N-acetyltransferase